MRKPILFIIVATTSLTQWAACGRAPYAAKQSSYSNLTWTPSTGGSSGGSTGSGTSPIIEQRIDLVGYDSGYVDVQTNSKLRVRVAAGINDRNIAGTGFSPQYNRMYVRVKAEKLEVFGSPVVGTMTPVMHNGLAAAAQQSPIYNLDNTWSNQECTSSNTACRETVRITIDQPNTDYYWTNGIYYYQPTLNGPWAPTPEFTHVQNGHPSNVTLYIQTVDTVGLQ